MARIIAVKLPDEVYKELQRRSREEGYTLVSDYLRDLILRELGREPRSIRSLIEFVEKLEEGDLPPRLYERIWGIVRSIVQEAIRELPDTAAIIEEEKIVQRLERRLQDIINPWTSKIDDLASKLASIIERIEVFEDKLSQLEDKIKQFESRHEHPPHGRVTRKRSAIERLREQGIVFESDVQWLRDRDAFFERLRREGAVILNIGGERVAIDQGFWEMFREKVEQLPTSNDEEIRVLLTEPQYKLFQRLRENGLIYFDATKRAWKFIEKVNKKS